MADRVSNNPGGRPLSLYKKLLYLYPKQYRDDYGEQLILTTGDMLSDTDVKSDRNAIWVRIFFDTLLSAGKEHYAELIKAFEATDEPDVAVQRSKKRLIMFGLSGVTVVVSFMLFSHPASTIPPLSSLSAARELSQGTRSACIADNEQAAAKVKADDKKFSYGSMEYSAFEAAASGGIADVPAGTNYTLSIGSYDGILAKGTITYEGRYGSYNYIIKKLPERGNWQFVSMVACGNGLL